MRKIELLAPAGSMESMIAAVNNGADAIYLGGSKFSARAYASNFDDKMMEEAVDYAHTYGLKVYVTINTLIKENEFQEAMDYIGFLYRIGVDALIIQDVGIVNKMREDYPDFEIHASTQMSIHNGEGALFFRDNGFLRIVLSRELTLEDIKYISKTLDIETEIFVHGALCVCYSGQCLMSSMIGGRSGNRGRCAQSCRLPYTLIRESDNKEIKGYLLSPKDICTIENIEDLIESGTSSLKVEGRMKRPEYVAGVIESYRNAIDNIYNKKRASQKTNKEKLLKLFNREGFSTAYLYKNIGKDMMAYKNPKNTGILMGEVIKSGDVLLKEDITLKDGVTNGENGFLISKILLNNNEVKEASKGNVVKIFPKKFRANDRLFKTSDNKLLEELKVTFEKKYRRKIDLEAEVKFKIGFPIEIKIKYNGREYIKQGELVQKALNSPISIKRVEDNLKKSGDIAYKISKIKFVDFNDGFMPMSSINNLRREILDDIKSFEVNKYKRRKSDKVYDELQVKERNLPNLLISINTVEQLNAVKETNVKAIALDIFGKGKGTLNKNHIKNLDSFNGEIYIKVPTIIKEEFRIICETIEELLENIDGLVTANAGIINRYKDKVKILGDYKLNLFNSNSLKFYNKHIEGNCLSLELNKKEIIKLLNKYNEGSQFFIYGKPEVMVSEYCPIGSTFGGKNTSRNCDNQCLSSKFILRDRMNKDLVIKTDIFCRSHIYNTVPINLIQEIEEIKSMGINSLRVDLIDEDYKESLEVINALVEGNPLTKKDFTKGHFKRGVE